LKRTPGANEVEAWALDQLKKSQFFHAKLHEWGVLETAAIIEGVRGEALDWDLEALGISQGAWAKVIHRGIKPVVVFAHPAILTTVPRAVAYYRMLAMVSQKSMMRIRIPVGRHERGVVGEERLANSIARHLNRIISALIEADKQIDQREFELWRGMAAGSQAQGSWQNAKGNRLPATVKAMIRARLTEKGCIVKESANASKLTLRDGRKVVFGAEPDVAFYRKERITAAIEVKGGIDPAGVLERVGAAVKSLSRAKEEDPIAKTILILEGISITQQARLELEVHKGVINRWFAAEELIGNMQRREEFFDLLGI